MEAGQLLASKDLIGRSVVVMDDGGRLGKVNDVILDRGLRKVVGIGLHLKGLLKGDKFVLFNDIQAIGSEDIMVRAAEVVKPSLVLSDGQTTDEYSGIYDMKVLADDGSAIGNVDDFIFCLQTGEVRQLQISGGIFKDLLHGQCLIDVDKIITFGRDVLIASCCITRNLKEF